MSSNDYYNSRPPREQEYQSYGQAQPPLQIPPSYHSQTSTSYPQRLPDASPVSPFDTPVSGHIYPMGGLDGHRMDSQSTLGGESRYQGKIGRPDLAQMNSYREDIPLRNHAAAPGEDGSSVDHVYDAPNTMAGMDRGQKRLSGLARFSGNGKRIPWVVYTFTIVQVAVFIAELVKNATLTGSPIEIHPSFNPMIGPSPWVLINMGARYMPCMHNVVGVQDSTIEISWGCPNTTDANVAGCSLSQLCGFGGVPNPDVTLHSINQSPQPDQWFRFIVPMFLHAGIIHIGFNMLLQMTLGKEMELAIGSVRFFLVYVCSGIFGFVLGGNFAAAGIASTGASGALFGILALNLLDLLYTWSERQSPWRDFAFIMLDVIISFVLGLLPGLDNFSHIGGFLMGLALGISILRSPNALRKRIEQIESPYAPVMKASDGDRPDAGVTGFVKNPIGFFRGRKPAWWAWWLIRAASMIAILVIFIVLLNNFYIYRKTCSWCKYLSCININHWCDIGNIQLTNVNTTSNTTNKRSLFDSWDAMAQLYDP